LAAAPTARGYVLASIDPEDGALRWQRENDLDGPGPVQLETGEALVAFVRATPAPYLHELDPETGAVTARARFGTEVLRSSFTPPPVRGLPRNRPSPGGWRLVREGREALGVDGPGGRAVLAEHDLFSDHAAFVELDDTVVVVTFCANASGASAFGVDRATGRRLWQSSPGSIGPIGHSRYSNDVRATLEDGRVVVYAQESSGRYVGVLDPSEGRLIGYEVWRR
ncbi:MAG: PQQ-binding-like beta-propeller repeat protein, partial [Myxococcales bacterium]|nr:PQQ-binding-like beta-propeller repeat protein [Myxococcales bacterium]